MRDKMNYKAIWQILARNFSFMRGKRALFIVGGILALGKLAVSFLIPALYEQLMTLTQAGATYADILRVVAPRFILLILVVPLVCLGGYWQKASANFATVHMQKTVFGHAMRMPLSSLETNRADKVLRATANVQTATGLFTGYTMTIAFKFLIFFFGALGILLVIAWRYALIGVVLSAVMFYVMTALNVRLRALERRALNADSSLAARLMDMISNLPIVKLFSLQDVLKRRYSDAGEEAYRCRLQYKVMRGATDGVLDIMGFGAQTFAILLGVSVLGFQGDFARLVYVSSMFSLMLTGVRELGNAVLFVQNTVVASERVYELLGEPLESDRKTSKTPDFSGETAVEFKHVHFSYLPGKEALRDVNLLVKRGFMTAIVGSSGCGKTTLLKLLEGFYLPDQGDILIGGASVRDMSNDDLRACFSYIPQDAQLFDGTMEENVSMTSGAKNAERVEECLREAAFDFSSDAAVGEAGGKLSGGQAQRVSIARALYRDAPIYLLDEATSALDSDTEKALQATIDNVLKDKTVVCVAHRLSTVRNAAMIVYMEDGQIVESGTHDDLMARKGGYYRLQTSGQLI